MNTDLISRSFVLEQIEKAIKECEDPEEKTSIEHFRDFIKVVPSADQDSDS